MLKKFSALFIIFSAALFCQSPQIKYTEYDLPNGLHVILHQDNSTPIVATTVTYHVGSKNEDPQRTGFAHFFEHLMFEGSENIRRGQIDSLVQNAGGQLNASTSFDQTTYYLLLPSNQLELALWIESERLLHAKIDSVGVETQRSVVKEERRQSIDNRPYGTIFEKTFATAFTKHPYKWTPIGSFQYIDQATIEEFRDFYRTFYVPNNAVLSIAGDIDIDQTKKLIDRYFSEIPQSKRIIPRPTEVEPKRTKEVIDTVYDKVQLPAVIQAYHIPAQGTDDHYSINMLTTLLSSGQSSRFYKALIDEKQLAIQVGSIPLSLEDPGLFISYAFAAAGKSASENETIINEEIKKVQTELISDEEFEKIRNMMEKNFINEKSKVLGIAQSLAEYYLFYKNTSLINTELERFMKVTKEDIRKAAQKYLTPENRIVLYYLPQQSKKN